MPKQPVPRQPCALRTRSSTRMASRAPHSASPHAATAAGVAGAPPHQPLLSPRLSSSSVAAQRRSHSHATHHELANMMQQQQQQQQQHAFADDESSYGSYSSGDSVDGHDSNYSFSYDGYNSSTQRVSATHALASAPASVAVGVAVAPAKRSSRTARAHCESAAADSGPVAATARKSYKPRKATHVVRREEKEELERELEKLRAELLGLKYRAMFPHMNSSAGAGRGSDATGLNPEFTGDVLRDAIKIQQLSLASVQAALSNYVRQHKVSPIHTPIRLGRDVAKRKLTLQALKDAKIAEGRRFLTERTRGLDMTKPFFEEERFETDEGDYCVLQFEVTPLPRARSVKELFDVLFYYIFNLEIKISEALGSITIREDDESGDVNISHHRFVSVGASGVPTEVSTVHFSDFSTTQHLGSGLIVADFVDNDELYPYRPDERVRHDLTAVLTITPERRRVKNRVDPHGPDEDEIVVTLTRWMIVKAHRSEFPIDDETLLSMRTQLGSWTDELIKAVRLKAASSGHV